MPGPYGYVTPDNGSEFTVGDRLWFQFTLTDRNWRVKTATIDGVDVTADARSGELFAYPANGGLGPDADVVVNAQYEYLIVNVTLRLTVNPITPCPFGMKWVNYSGTLGEAGHFVTGSAISGAATTYTTTYTLNTTDSSINATASGGSAYKVATISINGVRQDSGDECGAYATAVKGTYPPGQDILIEATVSADRMCKDEIITPPIEVAKCLEGTVWSGTACVRKETIQIGGDDCEAGYYWDGTACTRIPDGKYQPPCASGTHWDYATGACVSDCTPGSTHWNPITNSCDPDETYECPAGYHWNADHTACVQDGSDIDEHLPGKIRIEAYYELQPYSMRGLISEFPIGQTPVTSSDLAIGTYLVEVADGTLYGRRMVQVFESQISVARFDFFDPDVTNGLRVRAMFDGEYVCVPFTLVSPSSVSTDEQTSYRADDIATGTWTASTTWRGATISGSVEVPADDVVVIILRLPGDSPTLSEEEVLAGTTPDAFQVRWKDDSGEWTPWQDIDLGLQGSDEPFRWLSPMGIYRHRQYQFQATGISPVVVAWVEEDVDIMAPKPKG